MISILLKRGSAKWFVWSLIFLVPLQPAVPVLAFSTDDCRAIIEKAQELFRTAKFDDAIALVEQCLKTRDLPVVQQVKAYDLLAQSYLKKRDQALLEAARDAIRKLLILNRDYQPDADAEEGYKIFVEEVRNEPFQPEPDNEPEPGFPRTWHYIVGGAVVGGVILYLALRNGDDRSELPPPPGRPTGQ